MISTLYAAAARRRRERYAARPDLRRRLRHPVISIGNLAVGGRGKTPIAASVARLLMEMGERPAVLSRGYARARPQDGVVVVRDPDGIRADVARSGDEPMMLARQLPGASVLASADRYTAGRLAEHHFGATVHVLDDGFQHLQLDRDVDIVLLSVEDTRSPVTLPAGRLREPFDCIAAADAVLTLAGEAPAATSPDAPRWEAPSFVGSWDVPVFAVKRMPPPPPDTGRAFAVAGIAAPGQFFESARRDGWQIAGTRPFRDHHRYGAKDLAAIYSAARAVGAATILTTEKDFVRLLPFRPFDMPIKYVPYTLEPERRDEFRAWLEASLRDARDLPRERRRPARPFDGAQGRPEQAEGRVGVGPHEQ